MRLKTNLPEPFYDIIRTFRDYVFTYLPEPIFSHWVGRYEKIVLVYQVGKVASSTVYRAIRQHPQLLSLHFHRMPGPYQRSVSRTTFKSSGMRRLTLLQDVAGATGSRLMRRRPRLIHIITMVREPVSRNVSAFFQNLDLFLEKTKNERFGSNINSVMGMIGTKYEHDIPLKWFDIEFKENTGIDIFSYPFDKEAGYVIIREEAVPILILRTDLRDDTKRLVISEFLGIALNALKPVNVGSKKRYSELYSNAQAGFRIPKPVLDEIFQSKFFRHFFAEAEAEEIRRRWQV